MGKELTQISKYYQSFSGTDTLAFILMPGCNPVVIGSLTTISYSMFRNKKPVINIGRTNINGVTRGSRIFAGTMIFTLINQHWIRELQAEIPWLSEVDELRVDELPLFDIMIVSANEYGNAVTMYIYGIDFTDEAQTISVEDLFTENTFSFIARDIATFKAQNILKDNTAKGHGSISKPKEVRNRYYVLKDSPASIEEVIQRDYQNRHKSNTAKKETKRAQVLPRQLYLSSSKMFIGNDVAHIQELLNATKEYTLDVNGIFDAKMDTAVRLYQSDHKLDINGVVDDKMYNTLLNETGESSGKTAVVVNKYGAYVYSAPSYSSNIVDIKPYRHQVPVRKYNTYNEGGRTQAWYETSTGYIPAENMYSSYHAGSVIEFPEIHFKDTGMYVTMIQSALNSIYPSFTNITSVYDTETIDMVKQFQKEHDLPASGIVDHDTWTELEISAGNISSSLSEDNFNLECMKVPGTYNISKSDIYSALSEYGFSVSCDNYINIKISAVAYYGDKSYTVSEAIPVKEERSFIFTILNKAFTYNPEYNAFPDKVECIVYPFNKKPFKWIFNLT